MSSRVVTDLRRFGRAGSVPVAGRDAVAGAAAPEVRLAGPGPAAGHGTGWWPDLRAALPAWIAARLVVTVAWLVNAALIEARRSGIDPVPTAQGLWAWDGAYYRDLAELGYAGTAFDGIRFHPLVPVLAMNGAGVVVLANLTGLLAAVLIHRLSVVVTGDRDLAGRAATLTALAPPAFCLVWAYAEGPFLVLGALQLFALRDRRWWAAGGLGVLAALTRPTGLLLALPAAVEVWRQRDGRRWWQLGPVDLLGRASAVIGPVAGIVGFLVWAEATTGEGLLGVRIQETLRGGFVFPAWRLVQGLGEVATDPFGDGLHVPFAFGMVALVWVCWKRLPRSWTVLTAATVLSAISAGNLNSIERYAFGTVPVVVALAAVTGGRWWRPTVVLSTAGLLGMSVLSWYGSMTP